MHFDIPIGFLYSIQDECIEESILFQVLKMARFWLCAVTILSMCNLLSK